MVPMSFSQTKSSKSAAVLGLLKQQSVELIGNHHGRSTARRSRKVLDVAVLVDGLAVFVGSSADRSTFRSTGLLQSLQGISGKG
jgi:hypothetical protein